MWFTQHQETSLFRSFALTNAAQTIKEERGVTFGLNIVNNGSQIIYLKFYDVAGTVVVGTSPVKEIYAVAANSVLFIPPTSVFLQYFLNGIKAAVVTGISDSDATAPTVLPYVEIKYS